MSYPYGMIRTLLCFLGFHRFDISSVLAHGVNAACIYCGRQGRYASPK